MGITASLLLSAVGAILLWAVTAEVTGLDLRVVGAILLVVGVVGLILSMIFWSTWGGFSRYSDRRTTTIVD